MVELVPLEKKYLSYVSKWNYDPEINVYFSTRPPYSEARQIQWLEQTLKDSSKKKFIILHQISHTPIGLIGLMKIDPINQNAELGITIGEKSYWGTGAAQMATQTLLQYAFLMLHLNEVYAQVFKKNKRSIAFFSRLGFSEKGEKLAYDEGIEVLEMSLSKACFMNQKQTW